VNKSEIPYSGCMKTIEPEKSGAVRLEAMAETARRMSLALVSKDDRIEFENQLDQLARDLNDQYPPESVQIGFDKPATVYVLSDLSHFDSHRQILRTIIQSRPWERHIVLFAARTDETQMWQEIISQYGGGAIAPDASLGMFDRWFWLRAKLKAFAAQRLIILSDRTDVVAQIAARSVVKIYGKRLYLWHSTEGVCPPGSMLANATHLTSMISIRRKLKNSNPTIRVGMLSIPFTTERDKHLEKLPSPPPPKALGRRAYAYWLLAREKWRVKYLLARTQRRLSRSAIAGLIWNCRIALARMRILVGPRQITTATSGCEADIQHSGHPTFGAIIAATLRASGGTHLHIGRVSKSFRVQARDAVEAEGLDSARLKFLLEETSLTAAFSKHRIDLFMGSLTHERPGNRAEAAWAGLTQAFYKVPVDNVSVPRGSFVWQTPADLSEGLQKHVRVGLATRLARACSAVSWSAKKYSPQRFERRFSTIVAITEGCLTRPLENADKQSARRSFYQVSGASEESVPPLFEPDYYVASLPQSVRKVAAADPLAHYLLRGERLGHRPHPLFDPVICEQSFAIEDTASGKPEGDTGHGTKSTLATYLATIGTATPHMFFSPKHYVGQLAFPPHNRTFLEDFLASGAHEGLSPHPLVEIDQLSPKRRDAFFTDFLAWLKGELPYDRQPYPLFDAKEIQASEVPKRLHKLGPNLLWAHLVEGNLSGCDPHLLISCAHVEASRPGTMTEATTVLELIATNRLGSADPHPLLDCDFILKQAPWAARQGKHPLRYFLKNGGGENIDPHPWFSTQFYLFHNSDVFRSGMNPLMHYLRYGQAEHRRPSAFFNGHQYQAKYIHAEGGNDGPMIDYAKRGAGLFWNTLWVDESVKRLTHNTALALFEQECKTAHPSTVPNGNCPSADMLRDAIHPASGGLHPSLVTEKRALEVTTPEGAPDVSLFQVFAPPETVSVLRPAIVSPHHISPTSGQYEAPQIDAALYSNALVVAGNDGFIMSSGNWMDHGLAIFDSTAANVKDNAAVAAVGNGHVLLRRYEHYSEIPCGIFACGTYSKNYYHFLIETLPRALFAAEIAPPGTPLLADDQMPAQHYQALRMLLPNNPIVRLARHRTYKVTRLFAASMPNNFQDAFLNADVPHDAVRLHPKALAKLAALSNLVSPTNGNLPVVAAATAPRLFLRRESKWRKLLNSDEIEKALSDRGFTSVDFAELSFAEQIRYMANAEVIVAQSSAHLANIVFARPGCRVFALFSDAPGSNYNLWSGLGKEFGVDVINVVGWRVPGSTGGSAPEAHEHFTLPVTQITAFFPARSRACNTKDILTALHKAGAEANALTSAWALRSAQTPPEFEEKLIDFRRRALAGLRAAPEAALIDLAGHSFFSDPWPSLTSGLWVLEGHNADELTAISEIVATFDQLAERDLNLSDDAFRRLVLQAMLMIPAWRVSLIADPGAMPPDVREHYLRWIAFQPFLFREGDDEGYLGYLIRLLDWLNRNMNDDRPEALARQIAKAAANLDMGQLLLIEAPLKGVFAARNRLLERIALRQGKARSKPRPSDGSVGRRRIGILCRTFEKGPDAEAVAAIFRAFDHSKYDIYAYSVGFRDRVVSADSAFDREFSTAINHRRMLPPDGTSMRAQILADDLDVFLFANATTYGIRDQELSLYHPVAPVQAVLNSHVPMPLGFPSFSSYITGLSDHVSHDVAQEDFLEQLVRTKGPVISFLTSFTPRAKPQLDRVALGLTEEDVVMMNAGSFQKLRRECLITMMLSVRDVPNGVLLLAPYNPGWAARSQAFAFNRQLMETAAEVGLDPDRIHVLSELTVGEAEAALSCADVYLNPFPHGGATMTHLALIYGVPPVTLRRRSTRSIDQFLVASLGFHELLADTKEEYVSIAVELATDAERRKRISEALRHAARHPVFVDNPEYSREMQKTVEQLIESAERQ
jgi:predicted O-linked N-acetylglucosamine transferase (SPINDLY family)